MDSIGTIEIRKAASFIWISVRTPRKKRNNIVPNKGIKITPVGNTSNENNANYNNRKIIPSSKPEVIKTLVEESISLIFLKTSRPLPSGR